MPRAWSMPAGSECDTNHGEQFSVDAATASLVWDVYRSDGKLKQGTRPLTAGELQQVRGVLASMALVSVGECMSDAPDLTLHLNTGDSVEDYQDAVDQIACLSAPPNAVSHIDTLEQLLWTLADDHSLWMNFSALSLTSSGGMTADPVTADCQRTHADQLAVDATTASFTWSYCSSLGPFTTGSRTLTDAELLSVREAVSTVIVGTSGNCGYDKPVVTMTIGRGAAESTKYRDDFYSCSNPTPADGSIYVMNIDNVSAVLRSLVMK